VSESAHVTPLAHPRLPPGGRVWGASRPGYPGEPASPQDIQRTVREWVGTGVEAVVTLMEEWEIARRCPGLVDAFHRHELEVLRFPIVDFGAPADTAAFGALVLDVRGRLARGQGVLVHCNAGLGRTAVFLGSLLRACGFPGDAVAEIRRIYKPGAMENPVQEAFVRGFAGPASAARPDVRW
jgi:protein-tyrosine phosphatase